MLTSRRLFVINQHRETGEVLKAVLETERTEVTSVRNWRELEELSPASQGTVLVMRSDEELDSHPEAHPCHQLPRVVIGRLKTNLAANTVANNKAAAPSIRPKNQVSKNTSNTCCLDEIFEYPDLVNAIQRLWNHQP